MQIRLSDHFTYKRLLRFTLPSVVTMIIASVYSVVDGLFVSNLVGAMALSAINIAFPVAMIIGSVGFSLEPAAVLLWQKHWEKEKRNWRINTFPC